MKIPEQSQYQLIAECIEYLREHQLWQPSLQALADALHKSPHHLQRTFREWAGISPKKFLQYLTKQYAKQALLNNQPVTHTALDVGLSGSGRLHDLMITFEALTPGEIRQQGAHVEIHYGLGLTPVGQALIGWTTRGICHLGFIDEAPMSAIQALKNEWSRAHFMQDDRAAQEWLVRIFYPDQQPMPLHLLLKASPFQLKIWEALINSPADHPLSYSELASSADSPQAQRAVGAAMAANTIAYLIPCHRVIRQDGNLGQYRWGITRKQALLAWEAAKYQE